MRLIALLSVLVSVSMLHCTAGDKRLLQTNIVFRHGDRAPAVVYPTDPHNETEWPYGFGELTDIGKGQQYRLGRFLRQKYKDLVGNRFNYKEIYVRSSDVDRCLVSAYSNLAGFYSNSTQSEDLSLPFIRWQPIPVHTEPTNMDEVVAMDRPCKTIQNEQKKLFATDKITQLNSDYKEFFNWLSDLTGVNLTSNGLRDMWLIRDAIYCETQHNMSAPEWVNFTNITCSDSTIIPCKNRRVFDILTDMESLQFTTLYDSDTMHKLAGGPLLGVITQNFHNLIEPNKTTPSHKLNIYSGHDTTVAATLSALGVFNDKSPQYTACIMFELWEKDGKYLIEVLYKPYTDNETLVELKIPGCGDAGCDLSQFKSVTDKLHIADWDKECKNSDSGDKNDCTFKLSHVEMMVIIICSAILFVLIISAFICFIRRKKISSSYMPLSQQS